MIRHGLLMTSIAGALFAAQGCNGDTRQEPPSSVEPSVAPQPDAAKVDAAPSAAELRSVAGPTDPGDEDRAGRAEGPTPSSPVADPVASWARRPSRIAIGRTHVCVVGPSDHPVCWGDAREGRIGSTRVDVTDYVQLASITAFSLAAGDSHTCGLATSGEVRCWGSNAEGQLGIDGVATATPIELDLGGVAHQLSARRGSTCAVSRDHGLSCWMPGGPARRIAAVDPARVAVGPGLDGCMLDFEGAGSCWGGTSTAGGSSLEPRAVEGLPPSRDIGVGDG